MLAVSLLVACSSAAFVPPLASVRHANPTCVEMKFQLKKGQKVEEDPRKFKTDKAANRVIAAAAKFGSAQKDAAKVWVEQATAVQAAAVLAVA